jgi:hypothetical protein
MSAADGFDPISRMLERMLEPQRQIEKMLEPQRQIERMLEPQRQIERMLEPQRQIERMLEPQRQIERMLEPQRQIERMLEPQRQIEKMLAGVRLSDGWAQLVEYPGFRRIDEMLRLNDPLRGLGAHFREIAAWAHELSMRGSESVPIGVLTTMPGASPGGCFCWTEAREGASLVEGGLWSPEPAKEGGDQHVEPIELTCAVHCLVCEERMFQGESTLHHTGTNTIHIDVPVSPFCASCLRRRDEDPEFVEHLLQDLTGLLETSPARPLYRVIRGAGLSTEPAGGEHMLSLVKREDFSGDDSSG